MIDRYRNFRTVAAVGIALGLAAFLLALPPFTIRTTIVPIVLGTGALALGLAALSQGERRLGGFAIGVGFLGTIGGLWAQGVDEDTLGAVLTGGLLASTLRFATPLAYAAMGGIFSERSGVVNIGLEGMMLIGAFFAVWGSVWSGSWVVGVATAMLSGGLLALVHAVFSIHLRADQIVSGFAVNLLALGLTGYLYSSIYPEGTTKGQVKRVPSLENAFDFLGWVPGSDLSLLVWLMFLVVILSYVVLFKTPIGLRIRSVGEHPRAADTVGISVYGIRYAAVITSGVLAALGGAFLSIGFTGRFTENMTGGRGYIALAAVIFGKWRPGWAFVATLLFGFGFALAIPLQREADISSNVISTLPYVLTLIAVAGVIGRSIPPAAVGRPYVKQ
ncbi:MAG TPA: ABC transporter permease [Gaiellaceae bacterium]|nr:ABC transporter permease [Gaiellaceae bacterium]